MKIRYDGSDHEHEFEAETGLPEPLPNGERLLWQGSPDWWSLARSAFHVRKLAVYFAIILALRGGFALADGESVNQATRAVLMLLPLALAAVFTALALAWLSARTTVYTITDKRVVMRIGIVLGLTLNLPLKRIANAGLNVGSHGIGDLPLQLAQGEVIAFLHLWPHARPWRAARPEPMLRCVPEAADVARVLARAWSRETGTVSVLAAAGPASHAADPRGTARAPEFKLQQGH